MYVKRIAPAEEPSMTIRHSDEYNGRFAGSEENKEAAEYILSLFEEYEFDDTYLE